MTDLSTILSPERRREIREREQAATPGPWDWEASDATMCSLGRPDAAGCIGLEPNSSVLSAWRCKTCAARDAQCLWPSKEDASFIAHARVDIPALSSYCDEADRECQRLKAMYLELLRIADRHVPICNMPPSSDEARDWTLPEAP